jgi:uncharacterized protein YndB with AHSA1/START domain
MKAACLDKPYSIASDFMEIGAPLRLVWQTLTDFSSYGQWNPLCHAIEVEPVVGGSVKMQVQDDSLGKIVTLDYAISALEENRLLAWTGVFPDMGLVARRDQYVQALGDSRTIYWTVDIYAGEKAAQLVDANGPWVRDAFNRMADALRRRAESLTI